MKKALLFLVLFCSGSLFAQAPEGINYQAVARDLTGAEMPNTVVAVQVQILNSALAVVYQEDHARTTNAFGLFNIVVGQGSNSTSIFSNINWASSPYYLKISIDANGSGLVDMGYTQLLSVPYALYAKESANGPQGLAGTNCWDLNGNGVNDPAEDLNSDLQWNALDCRGDSGATGPSGSNGAPGATGAAGTNGTNGSNGATGAAGTNGTNGATGATGAAGTNGANGTNGTNGANGATGSAGATGPIGATGASGTAGTTGATGATGATGSFGITGTTGQTIYNDGSAWTATSNLYHDGTNVGIGMVPFYKLDVSGDASINGVRVGRGGTNSVLNTAVGNDALSLNTTGTNNTAMGYNALSSNLTGFGNTSFGSGSLRSVVSSAANSGFGCYTLANTTTGASNTAMGFAALQANITGSYNTAVGESALYSSTSDNNTAVGYSANALNTTGSSNTALGANAGVSSGALTNATAIGASAQVSMSNCLVLGNSANVGIGTSAPTSTFSVAEKFTVAGADGDVTFTDANAGITFPVPILTSPGMITMFASGTGNVNRMVISHSASYPDYGLQYSDVTDKFHFLSGGTPIMTVDLGTAHVGINNPAPSYALDVAGTANMTGFNMATGAAAGKVLTSSGTGGGSWQYPLTPSKFGDLASAYPTNNVSQYSYTPLVLQVTPITSGVLNIQATVGYNYNSSISSMVDFGLYISTSAVAPTSTSAFTSTSTTAGFAAPEGSLFSTLNVPILYSISVIAGQTYYIYIGMLDGNLSGQTAANLIKPRIIATLNSTSGL